MANEAGVTSAGRPFPLGATVTDDGANFSIFSKTADSLELLLFDSDTAAEPCRRIPLTHEENRTRHYWHVSVPGVASGQVYGYVADGPFDPAMGLRFDHNALLLDPYAKGVVVPPQRQARHSNDWAKAMKSVVVDTGGFDWEGDRPLRRPFSQTVIYELHVAGFTKHPSSGVAEPKRGAFAGLADKIPYLQELGVTAVELMPVFQFDPLDAPAGRLNYWGYAPVSFFAPHAAYSSATGPLGPINEFRSMVKRFHRAGIEVILDVVFNHTAEGNEHGPTLCYRGLDNDTYYILNSDMSGYANFSGCGNTLNANHSVVRRMILDSLRYWVEEMHVDGFRFDLASVLARDTDGSLESTPPILWDIETDPVLSSTKLIAEAWDAAGLYQVGSFFGDHWKEWNGRFRDDVRSFVRGDAGFAGAVASRFLASPDIYEHDEREPEQSVNFVTCHDGFTLNDLVSYDRKRNDANGEANRDGGNDDRSWNCGHEGPTDDAEVDALRLRQIKNFFTLNLLSLGVPMIAMGDEVRRTQHGNNNAYCQDNELSWFDWELVREHDELHRYVRSLIRFRLSQRVNEGRLPLNELLRTTPIEWHGTRLNEPDWSHESRSVSFTVSGETHRFHIIANSFWKPLCFELPAIGADEGSGWRRFVDTAAASPFDICDVDAAPLQAGGPCSVAARSVVVLVTRRASLAENAGRS